MSKLKYTDQRMTEGLAKFKEVTNGIYGWRVTPPEHHLPKAVKERIDYFWEMGEDGMTFMGAMDCIFSDKKPKDYDWGATKDWLPKSEEFESWYNQFPRMAQMEVAVYMIYGN